MKPKRLKIVIQNVYDQIETQDPEISTESLLQRVCDQVYAETGIEIDHGDVVAAL